MEFYRIPSKIDVFNTYQGEFTTLVIAKAVAWGVPPADVTKLTNFRISWAPAYDAQKNPITASTANKLVRDAIMKDYKAEIVFVIEQYLLNKSTISEVDKKTLNIKPKKTDPSANIVPTSYPTGTIDNTEPLAHAFIFHDSTNAGSKAKPAGVVFCEVRYFIGDKAPATPDDCTQYEMLSASGKKIYHDAANRGKTAYYFARWRMNTGEFGPWSPTTVQAIIN